MNQQDALKPIHTCEMALTSLTSLPVNRSIHQMRTISPWIIIRVNRRDIAWQIRNRTPSTIPIPQIIPPMQRTIVVHVHDRCSRALPCIALPELHVVIFASCSSRIVRGAPLGYFIGADRKEGGEFVAGSRAATVAAEGELAGDFGCEVSEEVRHGDEAAADDAGCDFGDAVCRVSSWDAASAGIFKLTSIARREIDSKSCREFWRWQRL